MKSKTPTLSGTDLFAGFVLVPIFLVLCYNYGLTEVVQNLGGPDGNVNIFEGALAVYATAGLGKLLNGGRGGL